jgi:hypothetical protein
MVFQYRLNIHQTSCTTSETTILQVTNVAIDHVTICVMLSLIVSVLFCTSPFHAGCNFETNAKDGIEPTLHCKNYYYTL